MVPSAQSVGMRVAIDAHRAEIDAVLGRYHASNPRLFGSVARGDATATSDIDVLVDLEPDAGNAFLRLAGLSEELSRLLDARVDVVAPELLRDPVARSAMSDAVAL